MPSPTRQTRNLPLDKSAEFFSWPVFLLCEIQIAAPSRQCFERVEDLAVPLRSSQSPTNCEVRHGKYTTVRGRFCQRARKVVIRSCTSEKWRLYFFAE